MQCSLHQVWGLGFNIAVVGAHFLPRDTLVHVNMWDIHHDNRCNVIAVQPLLSFCSFQQLLELVPLPHFPHEVLQLLTFCVFVPILLLSLQWGVYFLPRNTLVQMNMRGIHHVESWWQDAEARGVAESQDRGGQEWCDGVAILKQFCLLLCVCGGSGKKRWIEFELGVNLPGSKAS